MYVHYSTMYVYIRVYSLIRTVHCLAVDVSRDCSVFREERWWETRGTIYRPHRFLTCCTMDKRFNSGEAVIVGRWIIMFSTPPPSLLCTHKQHGFGSVWLKPFAGRQRRDWRNTPTLSVLDTNIILLTNGRVKQTCTKARGL